jgi:hypothetical protein
MGLTGLVVMAVFLWVIRWVNFGPGDPPLEAPSATRHCFTWRNSETARLGRYTVDDCEG